MQDLHSTSYLPRADARSPSGRRQPVPDRTFGAQGQRPSGAINPRGEAASTFGNTGKHRPGPGPAPDRAERRLHPQAPQGLVHQKSTASAVLLPIFMPYDVQWLLSPVPRRGDGDGWGGS